MRTVLAALVAVLALVATAAGDETQSCSAGARADDGAGATAVRAELDAMEEALAQAKSSLRALETLVETQSARLETMRALVATPGVTCDGSVAAAERLADAMLATRADRRDRSPSVEDLHDHHHHHDARLPTYRDVGRTSRDVSSDTLVAYRRVPYDDVTSRVDRPAVARRLDAWTDHLTLTGAVRLERGASATAMVTLPQRSDDRDDFPRYFAVGDSHGGVRVLRTDGDVAVTLPPVGVDHETDSSESSSEMDSAESSESRRSPFAASISSLAVSYQRKNETIVVAGDARGGVAFYQVFESGHDEEYPRTLAGTVFASYANVRSISPKDARGVPVPAKAAHWEKERDRLAKARRRRLASKSGDLETGSETYDLEASESAFAATVGVAHPQGARYVERDDATFDLGGDANDESQNRGITAVAAYRLNDGKKYFAVADASGALVVFADRGASVHSVYRVDDDKKAQNSDVDHVVAFKPSRRAISFVTRTGVGSLDPATFVLRRAPCAGTDDGRLRFASVAFDAAQSSKFYAVTESGETVAGAVGGVDVGTGAGVRATCALRHRDVTGSLTGSLSMRGETPPLDPPLSASLASVKGYAFAALGARVAVLNVTDAKKPPSGGAGGGSRAPREVVVADVTSLASAFGGSSLVAAHTRNGEDLDDEDLDDSENADSETGFEKTKRDEVFSPRAAIVATDARGSFVVVALPGGFIAMYDSALFVWKPEPLNTKLWSQPLYVAAMAFVAVFQFYRSKNGAGRRFAGGGDPGGFGADADALRQFDRMTRASRGADSSFDPAAFRRQMERDGRWKRTTKAE